MLLLSVRAAEKVGPLKNKTLYETANIRVDILKSGAQRGV